MQQCVETQKEGNEGKPWKDETREEKCCRQFPFFLFMAFFSAIIRAITTISAGEDVVKQEPIYTVGGNAN
jgi:hypothetical protein